MLDFVLLWPLVESSLQSNRARERFSIYFAPTARSGVPSSVHASTGRSFKQTENLSGEIVTPGFPFKLGSSAPGGSTTSNWCISVEKNKKSSNLAKVLPRHIRLPTPKAVVDEWKSEKSWFRQWFGLTHEELWLLDLSLVIDEARWVEFGGFVPKCFVHVNVTDEGHNVRSGRDFRAVQAFVTVDGKKGSC